MPMEVQEVGTMVTQIKLKTPVPIAVQDMC